jgi:hypothetical protein
VSATATVDGGVPLGAAAEEVKAVRQEAQQPEPEGRAGLGLAEYVIVALVALTVSVCVFTAGFFIFVKSAPQKLGVIDLPSIVELEEMSLTLSMMGTSVTDEDRAKAFERVKGFGGRLEAAIETARQECGCILLTRNAMVGQSAMDQTQRVKDLLGVGKLNAAELREKISKGIQALPDGPLPRK